MKDATEDEVDDMQSIKTKILFIFIWVGREMDVI